MSTRCDIAVIGGGMTGLTAAAQAAQQAASGGRSVVHVIGMGLPGGLVGNVGEVEGFPATASFSALDLALKLTEENAGLGIEAVADDVERLEIAGDIKRLHLADGDTIEARSVVAATGAKLKMLNVPGAERLFDKGVSQCAWCNGSLYKGADVVVVGGGDSALQEALHLAKFASAVTVVTRGEQLRARRSLVDRAAANDKIAFRWETEVTEIVGDDGVTAVRLRDKASGSVEELACRAVFVYVGLDANTAWLGDLVERDISGFVVTDATLATRTRGLFAAGAIRSGYLGRLTNAVGEATAAAVAAARHAAD